MSAFGSRGADDFARLLDNGLAAGPEGALVARLRSAGADLDGVVAPRPEFRAALRTRLVAVATVQAAAPVAAAAPRARGLAAAVSWSAARRGPSVAAGALASVVAFSGVAVAGSQSLPGDPFYGVKRGTEAVQLALADGELEEGTRHLDFAATRLREVRGLTLGRDAVDAGPVLGPSAATGSAPITLRSAQQQLATGAALSAPVAERVTETLGDMDEQTRKGTRLLTAAHRSSGAAEPLRSLSRFATRQSEGLEQLLPALPPATQDRARASLALVSEVAQDADALLGIGTCGAACDPAEAAPTVPTPGQPVTPSGPMPCDCEPAPAPAPSAAPSADTQPEPAPTTQPEPAPTPRPSATPEPSPTPSPSPSPGGLPLPVPTLPVPVPTLPVPVPTLTPPAVPATLDGTVPDLSGQSLPATDPAPAPKPAPAPVPAPTPAVTRR